jgi:hypothetical protein
VSAEFKAKIHSWLVTMGHTPVEQDDPQASWHFVVDCPPRSPERVSVLEPAAHPGRVIIAVGTEISPEHREGFDKLDDDAKETFQWQFRHALNNHDVDFKIQGAETLHECPKNFQILAVRYEDGLTLDSFARSIGAVHKTRLKGIWLVQEQLGPRGFGAGGRFDFKKLGF